MNKHKIWIHVLNLLCFCHINLILNVKQILIMKIKKLIYLTTSWTYIVHVVILDKQGLLWCNVSMLNMGSFIRSSTISGHEVYKKNTILGLYYNIILSASYTPVMSNTCNIRVDFFLFKIITDIFNSPYKNNYSCQ